MIISVHVPKTAGTSFSKNLESHFGPKLLRDYNDLPINTPQYERNRAALLASINNAESGHLAGYDCIHGHFLPIKYLLLSIKMNLQFITWLRDPVERIVSQFYYWRKHYDPTTSAQLHRRVVEEDWSLEKFCLSVDLQNIYGQFFWGFPLDYFDFIGITEFYSEDLSYFSQKYLGKSLEPYYENVGNSKGGKYIIDVNFRMEIEQFHAYDVALYKNALDLRQKRLLHESGQHY